MNLYIIVEDGKSGFKILSNWMNILTPKLERKGTVKDVKLNSYVIYSGQGYPRILGTDDSHSEKNFLGNTIDTINQHGNIDYLLVFLDGDDEGCDARKQIIEHKIENYKNKLKCSYKIFIQNKCIETWLLGNDEYVPKTYSSEFSQFINHYNILLSDPELMIKPNTEIKTNAIYHEKFLKAMLKEYKINYSKSRPAKVVWEEQYILSLKNRIQKTNHLNSLKEFFDFIEKIN